jgi:hypothetical protein
MFVSASVNLQRSVEQVLQLVGEEAGLAAMNLTMQTTNSLNSIVALTACFHYLLQAR